MQVRASDGTLLMTSSGMAPLADIHNQYVFLHRTKHATMVPQFTAIPGICKMLGGKEVA